MTMDPDLERPPGPTTEDAELWRRAHQLGSVEAREALFAEHIVFARQVAARHLRDKRSGDIEYLDLCQLAYAGLLEAIDRFDSTRGVPFRGFAARRITGSILDGIAKMSEVREQAAYRNRIRTERIRSLATEDPEGLSTLEAMDALSDIISGLALGFMLEGSGLTGVEGDLDERPSAYESLAWKETIKQLAGELSLLPDREKAIIRHHYLNGMTFDQIGNLLKLTKGRISQLHRAAIATLRNRLTKSGGFSLKR